MVASTKWSGRQLAVNAVGLEAVEELHGRRRLTLPGQPRVNERQVLVREHVRTRAGPPRERAQLLVEVHGVVEVRDLGSAPASAGACPGAGPGYAGRTRPPGRSTSGATPRG